ncbi:Uncharacterized protein Rs2_10903 [Raphanus sativus]|nr:Uncharacterized protein Rs2_10903 [Raphanus sativus]
MVRRRSMRFVNDIDVQISTHDQRRSVRLKPSVANPLISQVKNDSVKAAKWERRSPKNILEESTHLEEEEACGADVKAGGSSKKSKTMNQECIKDKPRGIVIIEDSPSSSQAKAAESGMIIENVLDHTSDKSDDSSQRLNTQEMNFERMEEECEEKLERDTVLMLLSN